MTLKIKIGHKEMDLTERVGIVFTQGRNDVEDVMDALSPSQQIRVVNDKLAPARIKTDLVEHCGRKYNYTPEEKEIYEAGVNSSIEFIFGLYG